MRRPWVIGLIVIVLIITIFMTYPLLMDLLYPPIVEYQTM